MYPTHCQVLKDIKMKIVAKMPVIFCHYLDLGSDTSSVWFFCARYSDVVLRGPKWRPRKTLAVFSGYVNNVHVLYQNKVKQVAHTNTNSRYEHYLTHAFSHITLAVAAMDGCLVLVRTHQRGIAQVESRT